MPNMNFKGYTPKQQQYHSQNLKTILTIIDLLKESNPSNKLELSQLQKAIKKWDVENIKRLNIKNQQLMKLQETYRQTVSEQMGATMQEIEYFLQSIVQEYPDPNLKLYYQRFMDTLGKMSWNSHGKTKSCTIRTTNTSVQTQQQSLKQQPSTCTSLQSHVNPSHSNNFAELKKQYIQAKQKSQQLMSLLQEYQEQNTIIREANLQLQMQLNGLREENSNLKSKSSKQQNDVEQLRKQLAALQSNSEKTNKFKFTGKVQKNLQTAQQSLKSQTIQSTQPLLRMLYAQAAALESRKL